MNPPAGTGEFTRGLKQSNRSVAVFVAGVKQHELFKHFSFLLTVYCQVPVSLCPDSWQHDARLPHESPYTDDTAPPWKPGRPCRSALSCERSGGQEPPTGFSQGAKLSYRLSSGEDVLTPPAWQVDLAVPISRFKGDGAVCKWRCLVTSFS